MNILDLYNKTSKNIEGFKERVSQKEMVRVIDECFSNIQETPPDENKNGNHVCIIEAPTGTGKSFAYILSGVQNAKAIGKKFLICTATKTLQGQLYNSDLPKYIKASGDKLIYGLAKGRSNYLCPYKLEMAVSSPKDILSDVDASRNKIIKIADAYAKKKWDGDLDTAPIGIDINLRKDIVADKHECLGYQCPFNQKDDCNCPFYNNREYLKSCDVIITNHSLLLADLDNGGGVVLPWKPNDYFLCVDEAHNFQGYAINGFMGQFELKHSIGIVNNTAKLVANPQGNSYIIADAILCDDVADKATELAVVLDKILQIINLNKAIFNDGILILNDYLNSAITQDILDAFLELSFTADNLKDGLEKIQDKLKEANKKQDGIVDEVGMVKLGFYLSTIDNIATTAHYLVNKDNSRFNANARWIQQKLIQQQDEFVIVAGVTHVGSLLKNKLWDRVYGATLTSATMAIGESFEYLKFQLGLNLYSKVIASKLPATFDYASCSQLVIPQFRFSPEYSTREMFQKELSVYMGMIAPYQEAYGTLVLFFNRQQLIDTFKSLPVKLQNRVLLQTEFSSNQKLIEEHKEIVDSGKPSIIFGLNSFAEGVDLPTKYCMHVIITKLPFETHKDPQNMVREYWVKAENGNFFMDVSLPDACIRLIQAVGRLIRSEKDFGQVTICDNRIVLKQYGGIMLNALPPFSRNYNHEFIRQSFAKIEH